LQTYNSFLHEHNSQANIKGSLLFDYMDKCALFCKEEYFGEI
jgi:hypothetical protein